jgi:hypothetical protein
VHRAVYRTARVRGLNQPAGFEGESSSAEPSGAI